MFVNTFCYKNHGKDDLPYIKRIDWCFNVTGDSCLSGNKFLIYIIFYYSSAFTAKTNIHTLKGHGHKL